MKREEQINFQYNYVFNTKGGKSKKIKSVFPSGAKVCIFSLSEYYIGLAKPSNLQKNFQVRMMSISYLFILLYSC